MKLSKTIKIFFAVLIFVWFYNFFPTTTSDVLIFGVRKAEAALAAAGDGMLVFGSSTDPTPYYQTWSSSTQQFSTTSTAPSVGNTIQNVVLKSSPIRDEMLAGYQTTSTTGSTLYIQRWNGSTWTNEWNTPTAGSYLPAYDIAYEYKSGEALVVYSANVATTNELEYRVWDGSSWSATSSYDATLTSGIVLAVRLESYATTTSNDIGLAWADIVNTSSSLSANYWNGATNAWRGEPSIVLSTSTAIDTGAWNVPASWAFDLAFESISGQLMVAWGHEPLADLKFTTSTAGGSGSWGKIETATAFGEEPFDINLESDPWSDRIAYTSASPDTGSDLELAVWDGAAWPGTLDTSSPCNTAANVCMIDNSVDTLGIGTTNNSIVWLSTSTATSFAVVTYDDANAAGIDWFTYAKSRDMWDMPQVDCTTSCSSQPASGDDKLNRSTVNPFNTAELMAIFVDTNNDLFVKKLLLSQQTVTATGTFTWSDADGADARTINISAAAPGFAADYAYNRVVPSTYEQSAYKWYTNANSSTVGAELTTGVQDASTTLSAAGDAFRLRMLMSVGNATSTPAKDYFKLQYASTTDGNCLPSTYHSLPFINVPTSTGEMKFNDNATPNNGDIVISTSTDPTHATRINQTYVEQNNFTVTSTIKAGEDGKWDFSLIASSSAPADTTYCFRVVKFDGTTIATSTSSKIPEIKTAAAGNSNPTVTSVLLNNGSAITLTPNATTSIKVGYYISDDNGCTDINTSSGGTSTVYRSGVSSNCAVEWRTNADNLNCYYQVSLQQRVTSTCAGTTINVSDTIDIWYFAQATDASSSYDAQNWAATAFARDLSNATGSTTSTGIELNTLLAITVTTSSINYGFINASSTTSSTNQFATTTNVGNATATYSVRASVILTKGGDTIANSNQRWATSSFNMDTDSGGALGATSTALTGSAVEIPDHIQLPATTTAGTTGWRSYWGLRVPAGTPTGTYTGTTVFSSIFQP